MSVPCQGCTRPVLNRYLCKACGGELLRYLRELPELLAELATTTTRQDRIGASAGPSATLGRERALPYRIAAADLLADAERRLRAFAVRRMVLTTEHDGRPRPIVPIVRDLHRRAIVDAARWPEVGRMLEELGQLVREIQLMIDLPNATRYLGCCDYCLVPLYADRTATSHRCPTRGCGRVYEIDARIAELLERARDVVASSPTIATALTSLEVPVTEGMIRKWVQRGRLVPRSNVGRYPGYRLGDVLDLLERSPRRHA